MPRHTGKKTTKNKAKMMKGGMAKKKMMYGGKTSKNKAKMMKGGKTSKNMAKMARGGKKSKYMAKGGKTSKYMSKMARGGKKTKYMSKVGRRQVDSKTINVDGENFGGVEIMQTTGTTQGDLQAGIEFIYHMREHLVDVGVATLYLFVCYTIYLWLKNRFK